MESPGTKPLRGGEGMGGEPELRRWRAEEERKWGKRMTVRKIGRGGSREMGGGEEETGVLEEEQRTEKNMKG